MNIEQAMEHALEIADDKYTCSSCRLEHRDLAMWLGELIERRKQDEWYEKMIEPEVRAAVRLLRDNGINTTCSCGEEMYIEAEVYEDQDVHHAYNILCDAGYEKFTITEEWTLGRGGFQTRTMRIEI